MLGVIATIPVGLYPADVVISPDGARAYVVNESSGTVSVIDTATNTLTTQIPVPDYPLRAAFSPDGARLYVVSYPNDRVSVIDTATNTVIADITVSDNPREVTIHPDGTRLYVVCANAVKVIDTAATTITATIGVGVTIGELAVSPDGARLYVSKWWDGTISVIDTASHAVASIAVGGHPHGVAVSPDGTHVYVGVFADAVTAGWVSVIDTATNTVGTAIPVGIYPFGVAVSPNGEDVYVTNFSDDTVSVIDSAANTVSATVPVGGSPVLSGGQPRRRPHLCPQLVRSHRVGDLAGVSSPGSGPARSRRRNIRRCRRRWRWLARHRQPLLQDPATSPNHGDHRAGSRTPPWQADREPQIRSTTPKHAASVTENRHHLTAPSGFGRVAQLEAA